MFLVTIYFYVSLFQVLMFLIHFHFAGALAGSKGMDTATINLMAYCNIDIYTCRWFALKSVSGESTVGWIQMTICNLYHLQYLDNLER